MITRGEWYAHPTWQVDAITPNGHNIDCKFVEKYWNIFQAKDSRTLCDNTASSTTTTCTSGSTSHRDDHWWSEIECPIDCLGRLSYKTIMQHIAASNFDPAGFYVDARKIIKT